MGPLLPPSVEERVEAWWEGHGTDAGNVVGKKLLRVAFAVKEISLYLFIG